MDHSSSSESSISSTHETGLFAAVCSSDINQDKFGMVYTIFKT